MAKHTLSTIMDHPRSYQEWVIAPELCGGEEGEPVKAQIRRIARICWLPPAPGHGERPLHVAVTDWGLGDDGGQTLIGSAGGFGYDKKTASLAGMQVGRIELGDHCDHKGRPTLDDLCRKNGWVRIGGW